MHAMVLREQRHPLEPAELEPPPPGPGQVLIEVMACGICRTDLHVVDGELPNPKLPLIPGHEIVGRIAARGAEVERFEVGERVGVPWLGWTCGLCVYCGSGRENLCEHARFTGYHIDGGYAEYALADERYCFPLPDRYGDAEAAPLLCAGLIGFRTLRMAGEARRLGFYGFGAAAHIAAQVARHQGHELYSFTRPGDTAAQDFAHRLTGGWVGGSDEAPPERLDAALIFAPVGDLVPAALRALAPGGVVVCGGIHMSDIPSFPYEWMWRERVIRSVANLTRKDAEDFLALAPRIPVVTETHPYPLAQANEALAGLREGRFTGAAVLVPEDRSQMSLRAEGEAIQGPAPEAGLLSLRSQRRRLRGLGKPAQCSQDSGSVSRRGQRGMSAATATAATYDRSAEDLGNIVELGHVNVRVPDQRLATLFYISGLGLTRDPFLMTGVTNMWANVGRSQFHMPTGRAQVVRGHTGLVIPDRDALLGRLGRVRRDLEGTSFAFREHAGFVEAICPWGNRIRCYEPDPRFGRITLGMPYVEIDVPRGAAHRIADFYEEILDAFAEVEEDGAGRYARIMVGPDQHLIYRETERAIEPYEGAHVQITLVDFSGPHERLLAKGLVSEESDQHQYRFEDVVDLDTGDVLIRMEHEVRSMRHPLYARPLVNRNPAQSNTRFAPGHETWAWSMPYSD